MSYESTIHCLGLACLAFPAMLLAVIGMTSLASVRISESFVARLTQIAVASSLASAVSVLVLMLVSGQRTGAFSFPHPIYL
jgi:NADH-quinone oxidoreductase subunit L